MRAGKPPLAPVIFVGRALRQARVARAEDVSGILRVIVAVVDIGFGTRCE